MIDQKKRQVFQRILVPITGTEADDDTVRMACWIAKRDKSKLYAMYIITIKRSLPLESEIESETTRAEDLLNRMENIADSEDCRLETDLLQAREIASTIIDEAVDKNIDLILMGVKYKRRFGQFSLGSIIPEILKNAPCQVILYSQYNPSTPAR